MDIGGVHIESKLALAPMAGVTDVPFRRLCRIMGESGLPDHLRPAGIPSWAAESGEGATASSPKAPDESSNEPRHVAILETVAVHAGLLRTFNIAGQVVDKQALRRLQ